MRASKPGLCPSLALPLLSRFLESDPVPGVSTQVAARRSASGDALASRHGCCRRPGSGRQPCTLCKDHWHNVHMLSPYIPYNQYAVQNNGKTLGEERSETLLSVWFILAHGFPF